MANVTTATIIKLPEVIDLLKASNRLNVGVILKAGCFASEEPRNQYESHAILPEEVEGFDRIVVLVRKSLYAKGQKGPVGVPEWKPDEGKIAVAIPRGLNWKTYTSEQTGETGVSCAVTGQKLVFEGEEYAAGVFVPPPAGSASVKRVTVFIPKAEAPATAAPTAPATTEAPAPAAPTAPATTNVA